MRTVVVVVLGDVEQGGGLGGLEVAEEDDVDVAVGLQRGQPVLLDGDDGLLHLLAEPLQHEVLGARAAEGDGHSVLEEEQRGEALDLELRLERLVLVQVDLGQAD